jgi:hypothetical protein
MVSADCGTIRVMDPTLRLLHLLALQLPLTQFVLRVEPVDSGTWMRMVAVATSVLLVSEVHKLLRKERHGSPAEA